MAIRPTVKLTRQQIYDEVWSSAVSGMAMKYSIPYSAMLKQIKDAGIPIPPPGYWTKKEFDKETTITELNGDPNEIISLYKSSAAANKMRNMASTSTEPTQEPKAPPKINTYKKQAPSQKIEKVELGEPEIIEWGSTKKNIYRREVLYKEIWQYPVTEVAKKYAVSDSTIHKICKSLDIPTPPVGYWAKIRAGQEVTIPPLPKSDKGDIKTGLRTGNVYSQTTPDQLGFMSEEDQTIILAVASQIVLADKDKKQHPKVSAYQKQLRSQLKTKPKELPYPADSVAEETLPRIFQIIDTLAKAAEPLGIVIDDQLHFSIGEDSILLRFSEATTEVRHELTREEKMAQLQYEDDMKRRGWGSKPHIRKYDYIYNGRISVGIRDKRRIRDSKSGLLEDRLGEILIAIFTGINDVKIAREEREAAERKREEERRRKEEFAKRYNEEVVKTLALQNQADDYAIACKIRALIAAIEAKGSDNETTKEWLAWATAKADWFDPTVAAKDPFFGTRNHRESKDKKQLTEKRSYYFW